MKRLPISIVCSVLALLLVSPQLAARQLPPYGGAKEYVADLAARRAQAMTTLGSDTVLVMWSAPTRVYSTDVDYEYRQESNMLYLSGLEQEDSILVLIPGAKSKREWLFTRDYDPRREHWNGHTLTAAEVTQQTGVANVMSLGALDGFMTALLGGTTPTAAPAIDADDFAAFFEALKQSKARLASTVGVGGGPARGNAGPPAPPIPGSNAAWLAGMQQKATGLTLFNAAPVFSTQRQVKTAYEQKVLRRSVEISAEAHAQGMMAARPDRWEYEVEAAIEYWYMKNGAMSWGYPSIVGSGPNATTLHYGKSTRQMKNGDLLLVDAAANFQGLTGDITRTYPVNGKFSAEQKAIYEIVLAAQNAGIEVTKLNSARADSVKAMRDVITRGLLKLGLITEAEPGPAQDQQVSTWYTHGPIHGIGVDVHDPLGANFVAGSAFVMEPGLYIRLQALDDLLKPAPGRGGGAPVEPTQAMKDFVEKVRPMVIKYKDIGVRIEDSFLMTDKGLERLSAKAPRTIEEIEKIVGTGK